jgi:photosystem II stability/assembly factor-like uncharacterized protein
MKKNMHMCMVIFIIFSFFTALSPSLYSSSATAADERLQSYDTHLKMKEASIFKSLKWRSVGPYFMGGRITDIEGYSNKPYKYYIATASSGLWVTENNGTTWTPIFDHESSITIGDIAVSQSDENLIWVGSGEQNSSRSSYAGTGIFKSIDGGKSWQNMGLTDSHHISRVIIDPKDNNIVYVAVLGHLYTDNTERGLYKTSDGGKSWQKVLFVSAKTGIIDVAMHPTNSNVIYAASWQRDRKAWNFVEAGAESALYKSSDGGKTWKKAMNGFPQTEYVGRIGFAVSPSNPDTLYAFLDNQEPKPKPKAKKKDKKKSDKKSSDANTNLFQTNIKGAELYRSNDSGESWVKTHDKYLDGIVFTYGYYFGQVRVAPDKVDTVYILGVPLMKSIDGGKTFKDVSKQGGIYGDGGVHADMQTMWIDPKDSRRLLLGNDGGLNISYDEGKTWQKINNIPMAQCYTLNIDDQQPYNLYTGLQDNGVNKGPSNFTFGNRKLSWQRILGGDGAFVQAQPGDTNTVFAEFQFGYLFRLDLKNSQNSKAIRPKSSNKKAPYRFNWLSPFFISPHNPYTLYLGGNKVLKSVDRGDHWEEVSPDLTDKKNIDGDVPFATIVSLDESPILPGLLYAGTDDGNLWIKKGAQGDWQKIGDGLPKKWVTRVVASQFKKERVYVTHTGYREDDFKTYVYASEDYGKSWKSIKGNLPEEPVNVIREDPVNADILYLGTDLTVYVSIDRGGSWYSLRNDLPTNAVYDLRIHPREHELIIATHGRGIFIASVKHLQQMTVGMLKKPFHLFPLPAEVHITGPFRRPTPVPITFYSDCEEEYSWVIKNIRGEDIFTSKGKAAKGLNCFFWNLDIKLKKKNGKKKAEPQAPKRIKKAGKGVYTLVVKKGKAKAERTFKIH